MLYQTTSRTLSESTLNSITLAVHVTINPTHNTLCICPSLPMGEKKFEKNDNSIQCVDSILYCICYNVGTVCIFSKYIVPLCFHIHATVYVHWWFYKA